MSLHITNKGDTIRATGADAQALFDALTKPASPSPETVLRSHLEAVCKAWEGQCGRVFESMGRENPRAQHIDEAVEAARQYLNTLTTKEAK